MAGLFEADYHALLKALGVACRLPTEPQTCNDETPPCTPTPTINDVADLLELGPSPVHRVAPQTPEPPRRWEGAPRLLDFDMSRISRLSHQPGDSA